MPKPFKIFVIADNEVKRDQMISWINYGVLNINTKVTKPTIKRGLLNIGYSSSKHAGNWILLKYGTSLLLCRISELILRPWQRLAICFHCRLVVFHTFLQILDDSLDKCLPKTLYHLPQNWRLELVHSKDTFLQFVSTHSYVSIVNLPTLEQILYDFTLVIFWTHFLKMSNN